MTPRQQRIQFGYTFQVGSTMVNESVIGLLDMFAEIREPLLDLNLNGNTFLDPRTNNTVCSECGGVTNSLHGLQYFTPRVAEYKFDPLEVSGAVLADIVGEPLLRTLQTLMFEKCFCWFASSESVSKSSKIQGYGPLPPITELIRLARSLTAQDRSAKFLPLLPSEVLYELCQVAQNARNPIDADLLKTGEDDEAFNICVDVTFEWGVRNETINPCNLTWEPRLLEESLAVCMSSLYLTSDPIDISDVTAKRLTVRVTQENDVYKTPAELAIEAQAAVNAAEVAAAAHVKELRGYEYTFSAVQAWWHEFSQVPPYNRTDFTRRKIIGYFGADGCGACGACGLHTRVDLRSFPGFLTKSSLPAELSKGQHFWARILPVEGDWRLDPFEARYTTLHLEFSISVTSKSRSDADFAKNHIQACVISNTTYKGAEVDTSIKAAAATDTAFQQMLFDYAGPTAFRSINTTKQVLPHFCQDGSQPLDTTAIQVQSFSGGEVYTFDVKGAVPELSKSAGGWFFVLQIGSLDNAQTQRHIVEATEKTWQMSTRMQISTLEHSCSDKGDGPIDNDWPEETWLTSRDVRDNVQDSCRGQDLCDSSISSGRQLDECLVCGGDCFLPACSAALGGCASPLPSFLQDSEQDVSLVRVRVTGEFAAKKSAMSQQEMQSGASLLTAPGDGRCSKAFDFGKYVPEAEACLQEGGNEIICEALNCKLEMGKKMCSGRRESYKAHTTSIHMRSGSSHVFAKGVLLIEPLAGDNRVWRLTIEIVLIPSVRPPVEDSAINCLTKRPLGEGNIEIQSANASSNRIRLLGTVQQLQTAIQVLRFTAHEPLLSGGAAPHLVLRFWFQMYEDGAPATMINRNPGHLAGAECADPWIGWPLCDVLKFPTDVNVIWTPLDWDLRRIFLPKNAGRKPSRQGRGGQGTHIAALLAGYDPAMREPSLDGPMERGAAGFCNDLNAVDACQHEKISGEGVGSTECYTRMFTYGVTVSACSTQISEMTTQDLVSASCKAALKCVGRPPNHNSLALAAKLVVVDVMDSGESVMSIPDDFANGIFEKAYTEAAARIFVLSFTCADFLWWNRMKDESYSAEFSISGDVEQLRQASICNRYTSEAREIDDYIFAHPDLLVIGAAGDGGQGATMSVSSPGTAKNMLTVGSTQGWVQQLEEASNHLASVCRAVDCPHMSVAGVKAGSQSTKSSCFLSELDAIPECCSAKYDAWAYSAAKLHWTSSLGLAVSSQASPRLQGADGDFYKDTSAFTANRIKPELVAPGLHILSARARGTADAAKSAGTCNSNMIAMSGSSTSAALVASAAALVRQYYRQGYSPGGYASSNTWEPSAALIKAVLLSCGQHVGEAMAADGSSRVLSRYVPNGDIGFGLLHLLRNLRLEKQSARSDVCACLAEPLSTRDQILVGNDYGSRCAPWDSMQDGRMQNCSNIYTKHEAYAGEYSESEQCCRSFCFVGSQCLEGLPSILFPGRFFSYEVCPIEKVAEQLHYQQCPWRNPLHKMLVQTFSRDHASPAGYTPVGYVRKVSPSGPPIAQGEAMSYNITIVQATEDTPVVITLSYTDPPAPLSAVDVLVNDLDLRVTVTPLRLTSLVAMEASRKAASLDNLARIRNASFTIWGNSRDGGDPYNNNEQVRLPNLGPSEIVVTILGKRISNSSSVVSPFADMQGCQTFALVVTGHLATEPLFQHPLVTSPDPLPLYICGRQRGLEVTPAPSANWTVLVYVLVCLASAVAICMGAACLYFNRQRFKRNSKSSHEFQSSAENGKNTTHQHLLHSFGDKLHAPSAYVSVVSADDCVPQCDGKWYTCRGGGLHDMKLDFSASLEDDAYLGMSLRLASGDTQIITKYDGMSQRAHVTNWDMLPQQGITKYVIDPSGNNRGYSFGAIPHVTSGWAVSPRSEIQKRQFEVITHVPSHLHEKVGKADSVRDRLQDAVDVAAGLSIGGRPVAAADLFEICLQQTQAQAGPGMDREDKKQMVRKNIYCSTVASLNALPRDGFANVIGCKHATDEYSGAVISSAPPLRVKMFDKRKRPRDTILQKPSSTDAFAATENPDAAPDLLATLAEARAHTLGPPSRSGRQRSPPPQTLATTRSLWSPSSSIHFAASAVKARQGVGDKGGNAGRGEGGGTGDGKEVGV